MFKVVGAKAADADEASEEGEGKDAGRSTERITIHRCALQNNKRAGRAGEATLLLRIKIIVGKARSDRL
ncbi:hypothetical protein CCL08_13205 [Pseudomonas congelans]|nr:hypothetical protein CCL08_13205 [Pseudomonas congelans]